MQFKDFANATYAHRCEENYHITTLNHVASQGRYNIYEAVLPDHDHVVTFNNQPKLLALLNQYPNALFAIKLVKDNDNIASYTVELEESGTEITARTIGFVGVLAVPEEGEQIGLVTLGATFRTV
jgi:hypothetical protein